MPKGQRRGAASLKTGRPPTSLKPSGRMSSVATRQHIRQYHELTKQLAAAERQGDQKRVDELRQTIAASGGLRTYQAASITGQSKDRGGDSSSVLLEWLQPAREGLIQRKQKPKMLEVGCLSSRNACSRSHLFEMTRIDLSSNDDSILQQDFMKRPLPTCDEEYFDIISLSLVLNFVPTPEGRGQMLQRTCQFLQAQEDGVIGEGSQQPLPALFLVLPAPCLTNSRYFDEERLSGIMMSLGYVLSRRKQTQKLLYHLWHFRHKPSKEAQAFPKKQIHPGPGRNNFCITMG